jgi:lipopolysaccharide transport system ATP-binding protein
VPIGGVVIRSDKGVNVHGKNSWQFDDVQAAVAGPGTRLTFSQEIALDLAAGEYVFEVGLASVTESDWINRARISHADMSVRHARICHLPDLGPFTVTLADKDGVPVLRHHGVANLPGSIRVHAEASPQAERAP